MDPMDDTITAPVVESTELNFSQTAEAVAPAPEPLVVKIHGKLDRNGVAIGTGRRKTSVARVRLKAGNGATSINGRKLEEYFKNIRDLQMIEAPLRATEKLGQVDLWVRVNGGGTTGQTGAIVMGIARALEAMNPSLHALLSENGFLTRDSRMVERKKYGFKKARRSPQFSKR
jgi:small subunit ribosomal protein S9